MSFEEINFPCYILLTDQISLPGLLYFVKYTATCVLQLFNWVVTSWILKLTLSFQSKRFSTKPKKSRDILWNILWKKRAFIEANKTIFLERESPTWSSFYHKKYFWYKMNVEHPMGVLHSFSIKNIFYDKMDLRLFYFRVTNTNRNQSLVL